MPRHITSAITLETLKHEAKRWLKALRANRADARVRFERAFPRAPKAPTLRDVQHALALEYGVEGWTSLKRLLTTSTPLQRYERVAEALVLAYRTGEESAMRIVWDYFGHRRGWDAMRRYVRLAVGKPEQPQRPEDDEITLADARFIVARAQDFESWDELAAFAASIPSDKATIASKAISVYFADDDPGTAQAAIRSRDWDEIIEVMRERSLTALHASGQMTDTLLERFSRLQVISALDLEGSTSLTDDGLRHLARLPRLRRLNLAGCRGITDRGLEVVKHLPELESIALGGTLITDLGAVHLAACHKLKTVDLSGTATGDGAIAAAAGKPQLHDFRSGNNVTDAGLALLHELPVFKAWRGGDVGIPLLSFGAHPNFLMLRGPFTDRGFANLVGLEGLFALNVDSNQLAITGAALAPLVELPHLAWLAFDARDESMPFIAALPHLRFLMCQDTIAGDDGFVALSRSRSIEGIWGRRCHNLQRRGFTALADMPALRALSVSCKNVDDAGVAALPRFPALQELMPMDVPDEGYRHIGRCERLESLVLMYCRETTDVATGHLADLTRLKKYFASYNRITDRTPEILSGLVALEHVTFDSCVRLTDAGVAALSRLPNLREVRVSGMPKVTRGVSAAFPPHVRVSYSL